MVVLGIDPGMVRLGFAVVSDKDGEIGAGPYGVIANPEGDLSFNDFLDAGVEQLSICIPKVFEMASPDFIASEYVPVGKLGANSESVVAALVTVKVLAYQFDIPWRSYGANTVKAAFVGDKDASKTRIRNEVIRRYPHVGVQHDELKKEQKKSGIKRPQGLPFDATDAIAIATVAYEKEYGTITQDGTETPDSS